MIKAVVFDLDDTLISEKEYIYSGFNAISEFLAKEYHLAKDILHNKLLQEFDKSSKNVFNRVLDFYKIQYDEKLIKQLVDIYRSHEPDIQFFDDVICILDILKDRNIKLGIITDGYKETQLKKIQKLKCKELFDEIIVTDELGREYWKPHEKSYLLMEELLNVSLRDTIYVGDNVNKDFITANRLGIKTVKVNRHDSIYCKDCLGPEYCAKFEIDNLKSLVNLL